MNRISGRLFEAVLPLKTYFHVILLQTYKQNFYEIPLHSDTRKHEKRWYVGVSLMLIFLSLVSLVLSESSILLITLIPAPFQPSEKFVIIAFPSEWQLNYHVRHWETAHSTTSKYSNHASHSRLYLISHYTSCPCLVWQVAISLRISVSLSLFLLTDVLNKWHPNSFTALFP